MGHFIRCHACDAQPGILRDVLHLGGGQSQISAQETLQPSAVALEPCAKRRRHSLLLFGGRIMCRHRATPLSGRGPARCRKETSMRSIARKLDGLRTCEGRRRSQQRSMSCIRVSTPLPAASREPFKADSFAGRDQVPKKVEGTGVGTSMQEARLLAGSTYVPRRPFRHEPGLFTAPEAKVARGLRRASALGPSHADAQAWPCRQDGQ